MQDPVTHLTHFTSSPSTSPSSADRAAPSPPWPSSFPTRPQHSSLICSLPHSALLPQLSLSLSLRLRALAAAIARPSGGCRVLRGGGHMTQHRALRALMAEAYNGSTCADGWLSGSMSFGGSSDAYSLLPHPIPDACSLWQCSSLFCVDGDVEAGSSGGEARSSFPMATLLLLPFQLRR